MQSKSIENPSTAAVYLASIALFYGRKTAFHFYEKGTWREVSFEEVFHESKRLALFLASMGLQRGDRVAILSESRPEYSIGFFGITLAGLIGVPLDGKLTPAELSPILAHSGARILLHSPSMKDTAIRAIEALPSPPHLVVLPNPEVSQMDHRRYDASQATRPDETALLVYTSGTTSDPKGVMIRMESLAFEAQAIVRSLHLRVNDVFLSILPLNHLLEITGGLMCPFSFGASVVYANTLLPTEIVERIRERKVSDVIAVPLFFRALKRSLRREMTRTVPRWMWFHLSFALARILPWKSVRRRIFAPVHRKLGDRLSRFVCGGSALEPRLAQFFNRMGITILQGYGLTETGPVISVNRPQQNRFGSVGIPLEGVQIKIHPETGEILTRGPHVMQGYFNRNDLVNDAFDEEGWFRTGDLGHIDPDGFLYVTGRAKELIVLGSGKKVFPDEVESKIAQSRLVKEICVMGACAQDGPLKGTEVVCAIVVPSDALLRESGGEPRRIHEEIHGELKRISQNLAAYKRPSEIVIWKGDFPKTSIRKVKRAQIREQLAQQERREQIGGI